MKLALLIMMKYITLMYSTLTYGTYVTFPSPYKDKWKVIMYCYIADVKWKVYIIVFLDYFLVYYAKTV